MEKSLWPKMIGLAIFYSSIQAAIGSVEMSSKFSVINFSKDQETLQRAADALRSFIIVSTIWTVGTILVMYAKYGYSGAIIGFLANVVMISWIYFSYLHAFGEAVKKSNLTFPVVWKYSIY